MSLALLAALWWMPLAGDLPGAAGDAPAAAVDSSAAASSEESDDLASEEPPEDADPARDFERERADSLASGVIDVGYEFTRRGAGPLVHRERLGVRDAGFDARVRAGRADALSGASLGAAVPGGRLTFGRMSPRWGRGLAVGTPFDPVREAAGTRGAPGARAAVGDGLAFHRDAAVSLDLVMERVRHTQWLGASLAGRESGLGVTVTRTEPDPPAAIGTVWHARGGVGAELAMDARGRWRLETGIAPAAARLALAARFGHEAFAGAVPARTLRPAIALAGTAGTMPGALRAVASGAVWRFRSAAGGARAALEVRADLPQHDRVAVGLEERHGLARLAESGSRSGAFRQGAWLAWRGGPRRIAWTIRHELWSAHGGLRGVTRRVASAGLTARPLRGFELGVTAAVFRARSGEPQYLTEDDVDRRVLRALTGAGRRTRLNVEFPAAGGGVRAALTLAETGGRRSPPQWTLDWSRRVRTR